VFDIGLRAYLVFVTFLELRVDTFAMSCVRYTEVDLSGNHYMKCCAEDSKHDFSDDICTQNIRQICINVYSLS
jgi:hypothetical protein